MGLESINFVYRSDVKMEAALDRLEIAKNSEHKKFVFSTANQFWIDLELENPNTLRIRVLLANPTEKVLQALHELFFILFESKGKLIDLSTKNTFKTYDAEARREINDSFKRRKKVFNEMHGNIELAISSDEFYTR